MITRRNLFNFLCTAAGIAAAAVAQQQGDQNMPAKQTGPSKSLTPTQLAVEQAAVASESRSDRTIPTIPGGSCLQSGLAAAQNGCSFNLLDNFHPTAAGTVTQVNWAGIYRNGLTTFTNAAPPAGTETFQINFYTHNTTTRLPNGQPNGLTTSGSPAASFNVTPTRAQDTAPATLTIGGVVYNLFNYTATIPGFSVDPSTCYWIEIRNTTPGFDFPLTTTGYQWRWARASGGDNNAVLKDITTSPSNVIGPDLFAGDFAFCLNVPFDRASPCQFYPSCAQATANCQNYGTGTNNFISSANQFVIADNFRVTAAGTNLTGICFTGFYAGQIRPPADETFTINIRASNTVVAAGQTQPFNFPGAIVSTVTLNNAGGVGNSAYSIRAARFNTGGAGAGFLNFYEWTSTFSSPVALPVGCYWIEIINNAATGWAWLSNTSQPQSTATTNGGDQVVCARTDPGTYDASSQVRGPDRAFCLSFSWSPIGTACPPGPAAANATCAGATALPLTGAVQYGFSLALGGGGTLPPTFGSLVDNTNEGGVWYSVVGNGQNITISTCNTTGTPAGGGVPDATNYDTLLGVYCASSCAGPFKAIAFNDDQAAAACTLNAGANAIGASSVTFPSVNGQTYYVFVSGPGGGFGFHWISASTAALGTTTPSPCADIQEPPCVLGAPPAAGPGVFLEPEICGDTVAGAGDSCQNPYNILYADNAYGTIYTNFTTRDRDFYKLPDLGANTFLNISLKCEAPTNVFVVTNGATTCPATGDPDFTNAVGFTIFPSCRPATYQFQVNAPAGNVYVLVLPTSFDGLACSTARNRYVLNVTQTSLGACCVQSGSGCTLSTREFCGDPLGDNGQYIGDGTVCSPTDCDPNTGTAVAPVGACCTFDGDCTITTSAGCGTSNSWLGAATTCTATGCPTVQACCFPNGFCTNLTAAACASQSGSSVTGRLCLPNSCPVPPPIGSCCNASTGACTPGITQAACTTGAWTQNGTCSPNTCPQPIGACCNTVDGVCTSTLTFQACTNLGANFTFQGNGSVCSPNPCPQPSSGRCCVGARCVIVAQASCVNGGGAAGTQFTPGAANCNANGVFNTPCCFADYNKAGGVSVQDIFDFLTDWFNNNPNANVQGNGAPPSVQDIFDFLTAWFSGGC